MIDENDEGEQGLQWGLSRSDNASTSPSKHKRRERNQIEHVHIEAAPTGSDNILSTARGTHLHGVDRVILQVVVRKGVAVRARAVEFLLRPFALFQNREGGKGDVPFGGIIFLPCSGLGLGLLVPLPLFHLVLALHPRRGGFPVSAHDWDNRVG